VSRPFDSGVHLPRELPLTGVAGAKLPVPRIVSPAFFIRHPISACSTSDSLCFCSRPYVQFRCDINYDVFNFMQDWNKTYSFTISPREIPETIETLWSHVKGTPTLTPEAKLSRYVLMNGQNSRDSILTISTKIISSRLCLTIKERPTICVIVRFSIALAPSPSSNSFTYSLDWSNFEIADMDFWRSQVYTEYFNYLDSMGGFYYEVSRYLEIHTLLILSIAIVLAALGRCTGSQHSRVFIFAQRSNPFL
jgi:hypothetical protein